MNNPAPRAPRPKPTNAPAARAGMLLVALGCVAGVIGALCVLFVVLLPAMRGNPEVAARLDELQREIPIDPVVAFGVMAALYLIYSGTTIPLGVLARRGRSTWVIVALVLSIIVGVFLALSTLASVATGNAAGALLPALLAALHGMAAAWLIAALREPTPAAPFHGAIQPFSPITPPQPLMTRPPPQQQPPQSFALPPPPQPMQGYYEPLPNTPAKTRSQ